MRKIATISKNPWTYENNRRQRQMPLVLGALLSSSSMLRHFLSSHLSSWTSFHWGGVVALMFPFRVRLTLSSPPPFSTASHGGTCSANGERPPVDPLCVTTLSSSPVFFPPSLVIFHYPSFSVVISPLLSRCSFVSRFTSHTHSLPPSSSFYRALLFVRLPSYFSRASPCLPLILPLTVAQSSLL